MKYFAVIFRERIWKMKTIVFILLNLFFMDIYLAPLRKMAENTSYQVEAGVIGFLLSDVYYLSVFLLSVLYFFSDIPFFGRNQMFYMIRLGRKKWAFYNCLYLMLAGFLLITIESVLCVILLFPVLSMGNNWGKVLGTLSMTNAGVQTGQAFAVNYGTILELKPWELFGLTYINGALAIACMGMLVYGIFLLMSRTAGALTGGLLIVLPGMGEYFLNIPWNYISPLSWMRTGIFFSGKIMRMPTVTYMLCGFGIICVTTGILIILKIRNFDINWIADNRE